MAKEGIPMRNEINTPEMATKTIETHDTLDHLLFQTVNEHPFTVSGGALIIGITILKIIKKLRGR
jgi:hypothetical protein